MWNANLPYVVFGCLPAAGCKFNGGIRGMDSELGIHPRPLQQRRLSDCNSNANKSGRRIGDTMMDYPSKNASASAMTNSSHASSSSCSEIMHDSGDYQWCLEYAYNREYNNGLQKKLPKSVLASALVDANEVSYDDLSKNIDANLAEIDMEDFRSEDIHSILSLPAMICAETSHVGEKFASASNSLLRMGSVGTPAEEVSAFGSASSNRSSSENGSTTDMSICKDEPLFSPMKEQAQPIGGAISTDSLDCSGFEEPDLVLTCRANKNNYTIAFEGSSVQFSDDSDYLEGGEATGSSSGQGESGSSWQQDGRMTPSAGHDPQGKNRGDMIQSDMVFTTWSKLRRLKETGCRRQPHHHHVTLQPIGSVSGSAPTGNGKSQSLPNLLRQSMMLAEMMSSRDGGQRLPIYDVQNRSGSGGSGSSSQLSHSRDSENSDDGPMSLLKLFIQQRGQSSLDSSSQSEASSSLGLLPPMLLLAPPDSHLYDLLGGREDADAAENSIADTTDIKEDEEANNNNIRYDETGVLAEDTNQNNNNHPTGGGGSSEESSSQCFEDSLVEVPPLLLKGRTLVQPASPIKEEEELAGSSSGDETMRDLKDPFSSDSNTTDDLVTVAARNININNNNNSGGNVFPTNHNHHKLLNIACCTTSDEKMLPNKNLEDLVPASLSTQGTQTGKGGNQLGVPRQSKKKGESSSKSSSRCSLSLSSQESIAGPACWSSVGSGSKKLNVSIATTRTCGTQIPVHIRDQEVQTCSSFSQEDLSSESQPWSFTLREDDQDTDTETDTETDSDTEEIVPTPRLELREAASSPIEEDKKEKKSIYVCYPNYSLPDLSFLRNISSSVTGEVGNGGPGDRVVLNPTGRDRNGRQPAQRRSLSSEGRTRPRSCADFDGVQAQNFGHIRDWESLKVLLPDEIRQLIVSPKEAPPSSSPWPKGSPHYGVLRETPSNIGPLPPAPLVPKRSLSLTSGPQAEPTRGILRKSSSAHQCSAAQQELTYGVSKCSSTPTVASGAEETRLKRRSLQEPFHCLLDNIPESQQQRLPLLPLLPPREPLPTFAGRRCSREELEEQEEEDLREVLVSSSSLAIAHNLLANKIYNKQVVPVAPEELSPQELPQQGTGCSCCMRHRKSVSFGRGDQNTLPPVKDKSVLLKNLKASVLAILEWFELDQVNFEGSGYPSLESLALEQLCPALAAILSEGLVPSVNGLFGQLPNSPWRIAEASCQIDVKVREVQELVAYVNGEAQLKDSSSKFSAFVLGLLNLKHLEQWLLRLLSCTELLQSNYSASCSLLLGPACLGWQQALVSCVQPLACLAFHCNLLQAAVAPLKVSPTSQGRGSLRGRRRPLSCIEGNQRYPASGGGARPASWDGQELVCRHPGLPSPCDETKAFLAAQEYQEEDEEEEEDERLLQIMMSRRHEEEPSLSADSGCSCSVPPGMTPSDDAERNENRFQELRNKWEQMGNEPTPAMKQVSPPNKAACKPPLPVTGRTPESARRGRAPAITTAAGTGGRKGVTTAQSEKKVVLRSKLPSPARAQTPESRPQTPESPQRTLGSARGGQIRGRPSGVIRKSLIPVHTPGSGTGAKVKRGATSQQPLRPPNRGSNF